MKMSKVPFVSQISSDPNGPPSWLHEHELKQLIVQDTPKFQRIASIRTRSEQFTQSALRVQIEAELAANATLVRNYLVKSEQQSKEAPLKFPRTQNFQLDLHMHNVILPALVELYKNVNLDISFSPHNNKAKSKPAQPSSCLYLDYLQTKGYRVANQAKGLDKSAMETVLSKLAAYHAASAQYLELNPGQVKELAKLAPTHGRNLEIENLKNRLRMRFWESLRTNDLREYEDKVKAYLKYASGNVDTPDPKKSFRVITVGSCWPNNILGNFDAFGKVKDVVFVDFGSSFYGPAVYDLMQLLLTAPAEKTDNFDAFLRHYQNELVAHLQLLKYKRKLPTLTDLQLDLLNYGNWAFEVITEILPVVLSDFERVHIEDIFKTPNYAAQIQKLMPWLENRGYFELE